MPIMRARYEIVAVPQVGPPLHIRQAWPGIIVDGFTGFDLENMDVRKVGTNEAVDAYEGVHVFKYQALHALREAGKIEAVEWWHKNSPPRSMWEMLLFHKDEMRRISEFETFVEEPPSCGHPPSPEDQDRYDPLH